MKKSKENDIIMLPKIILLGYNVNQAASDKRVPV